MSRIRDNSKGIPYEAKVEIVCSCGKKASAGYSGVTPMVIHEEPACGDFLDLEPDQYLAKQNRRRLD
jgi:hypothetical protein